MTKEEDTLNNFGGLRNFTPILTVLYLDGDRERSERERERKRNSP